MTEFEKIHFNWSDDIGVCFQVEENHLLINFEEILRSCDFVFVKNYQAQRMFEKRSKFEAFARERGFKTQWDDSQHCFVCTKELPWIE